MARSRKQTDETVSNRIRELRFHANEMTQQELADRVGVSRQTVVSVEKNRHSPSLELAFRIARAFGVPLEEVFSFESAEGASEGAGDE